MDDLQVSGNLPRQACAGICEAGQYRRTFLTIGAGTMTQDFSLQTEYLAAIVESATDAIVGKDLNGIVTVWNGGAVNVFGYSREEMIGRSILTLIPPDRQQEEADILERVGRGEVILHLDTVRLRKGGEAIHVSITVSPIRNREGIIIGASKIVRDISARKRWEEHSWLIIEAAPVAMMVVNHEGRIAMINAQTERLFGYERRELIGKKLDRLLPESVRARHQHLREGFMANPQTRLMGAGRDLFALKKNGGEFPVEIGLTPVHTSEGMSVVTSIVDITERKHAENRMKMQQLEMERSNKDLEQFAYVASHDLQEPLRSVAGCVQLLQRYYKNQLDARADEFISNSVEGCKRMQSLIDDLLAFSRIGQIEGRLPAVDCAKTLGTALKNLSASIEEGRAEITTDELPFVSGEASQLIMLFQNLVGNAIKFRKAGEPSRIHIGAVREGDWVTFSVRDEGIGIDPKYFDRIFGVFQRLHTRLEYPGTGIGLAMCNRITDRHGGRIWVESTPGRGSTFYFTLPALKGELT
jgi:PAS domain S-box-containing protein